MIELISFTIKMTGKKKGYNIILLAKEKTLELIATGATTIEKGGAETHLLILLKGLRKLGYTVELGYLKGRPDLKESFENADIKVTYFPLEKGVIKAFFKLFTFFKYKKFDMIHTHLIHADWLGIFAGFLAGVDYRISSKHNDDDFRRKIWVRIIDNINSYLCSKVIVLSDSVKRFMNQIEYIPKRKLKRIYYGYEPITQNTKIDLRNEYHLDENSFIIGTVGRLTFQKGQKYLIEAFSKLCEKHDNIVLFIIGVGELEQELKQYTLELNISSKIIFAGFRKDAPSCIADFDIFAFPSLFEGFGMVLLEAFHSGVPVVASSVSAIPEVVEHNVSGILVEPKRADLLYEALDDLIEDDHKRISIAENGYDRYKNVFTVEKMIRNMDLEYKRIVNE